METLIHFTVQYFINEPLHTNGLKLQVTDIKQMQYNIVCCQRWYVEIRNNRRIVTNPIVLASKFDEFYLNRVLCHFNNNLKCTMRKINLSTLYPSGYNKTVHQFTLVLNSFLSDSVTLRYTVHQ